MTRWERFWDAVERVSKIVGLFATASALGISLWTFSSTRETEFRKDVQDAKAALFGSTYVETELGQALERYLSLTQPLVDKQIGCPPEPPPDMAMTRQQAQYSCPGYKLTGFRDGWFGAERRILSDVTLMAVYLYEAKLSGVVFDRVRLMMHSGLADSTFYRCIFDAGNDWAGAEVRNTLFQGCLIRGPVFLTETDLSTATFLNTEGDGFFDISASRVCDGMSNCLKLDQSSAGRMVYFERPSGVGLIPLNQPRPIDCSWPMAIRKTVQWIPQGKVCNALVAQIHLTWGGSSTY